MKTKEKRQTAFATELRAQIDKLKVPFEKQTKAQKRVTIAMDVLAQLTKKRFVATQGTYMDQRLSAKKPSAEVCELTKKQKKCDVCALGGMFVAAVEKADKLKVNQLHNAPYEDEDVTVVFDDCLKYLGQFFDEEQLRDIETAFEADEDWCGNNPESDAYKFVFGLDDPTTRMRLIMENIVANNGRFKPSRKPVATYVTPGFAA